MLHTKSEGHRPSGYVEDFLKVFLIPVYLGMMVILIIGPEQFVQTVTNLSCLSLTQKCFDRSPPSIFTAVLHCSDWLK